MLSYWASSFNFAAKRADPAADTRALEAGIDRRELVAFAGRCPELVAPLKHR
jgi:hypothetical protein